jgi:hypothetical protein
VLRQIADGGGDRLGTQCLRDQVGVFAKAVAGTLDMHDDGVVKQSVQQRGGDYGIAEHVEMPHRLIVESLGSGWLIRTIHCTASAIRPASGARGEGRG